MAHFFLIVFRPSHQGPRNLIHWYCDIVWSMSCSYMIEEGICYMVVTQPAYPRELAFLFLSEVRDEFIMHVQERYGIDWQRQVEITDRPFAFVRFGELHVMLRSNNLCWTVCPPIAPNPQIPQFSESKKNLPIQSQQRTRRSCSKTWQIFETSWNKTLKRCSTEALSCQVCGCSDQQLCCLLICGTGLTWMFIWVFAGSWLSSHVSHPFRDVREVTAFVWSQQTTAVERKENEYVCAVETVSSPHCCCYDRCVCTVLALFAVSYSCYHSLDCEKWYNNINTFKIEASLPSRANCKLTSGGFCHLPKVYVVAV